MTSHGEGGLSRRLARFALLSTAWAMIGVIHLVGYTLILGVGALLLKGGVNWGGVALLIGFLLVLGVGAYGLGDWFARLAGTSIEEMKSDSRSVRSTIVERPPPPKSPDPLWDRDLDTWPSVESRLTA